MKHIISLTSGITGYILISLWVRMNTPYGSDKMLLMGIMLIVLFVVLESE